MGTVATHGGARGALRGRDRLADYGVPVDHDERHSRILVPRVSRSSYRPNEERLMPLIDLYYPAGTFTPEARTELADGLTTVLLRAERAPDTEFFRKITWIHVHEQP